MNMEVSEESMKQAQPAPSATVSSALPFSFFFPPNHSTSSQMTYGVEELYSQLSVMPLRSDGSLCIREALSRSQQEGLPLSIFYFFLSSLIKNFMQFLLFLLFNFMKK